MNVLRENLLRTALTFSYDKPTNPPDPESDLPAERPILRLGAAQELCFSNVCWSSVTLNAFANWDLRHGTEPSTSPSVILLIGGTFALGPNIKLLLEPQFTRDWHYQLGTSHDIGGTASLSVGVRATGPHVAFDLGLVPFDAGETGGPLPWIAVTYRTSGKRPEE